MADTARKRPDPRPMRLAYAAGAIAAVSAISAGLVHAASSGTTASATTTTVETVPQDSLAPAAQVEVQHVIRYIHLKPGESAPPGAKVITPDAPAPRVVVTHVAAPAAPPVVRRVVVTRQSGKP